MRVGDNMKYEEIVAQANEILAEYDVPLTLRQLFYRLVSKHVFLNTMSNYKGLSHYMVKAREDGDVDASRIEDRSRQVLGDGDYGFESGESFLKDVETSIRNSWEQFSLTLWEDQPFQVLVVLEKDALSRLVSGVAGAFRVKTFPTRGYGSYTYVNDIAAECNEDKPTVVLYLGDYDPSGLDIERDLENRLNRYGAGDFEVKRVALTMDQIRLYQLPPLPAKTSDPRLARFIADTGGMDAVELDALPPNVLEHLVRSALLAHIDLEKWNDRIEKIEKEREKLRQKLEDLKLIW